ncbi:hypothetical protein ACHQM5_000721 [Ranunculus cassubicifolius]
MGEEELKKVESEVPAAPSEPAAPTPVEATKDVHEEKAIVHHEEKVDDTKALAVVDKAPDAIEEKKEEKTGGSQDRDKALTRVETEKRLSLIKAWEESEKTKAENKAQRKKSSIDSWENTRVANIENQLKKIEEELEKKKAEATEKLKNKIALIHKAAEEKKAEVIAMEGQELLKAEETAAKYRATNMAPKKLIGCFGM